jgi:hypothetical protein
MGGNTMELGRRVRPLQKRKKKARSASQAAMKNIEQRSLRSTGTPCNAAEEDAKYVQSLPATLNIAP